MAADFDNEPAISGSKDKTLKLWSLRNGSVLRLEAGGPSSSRRGGQLQRLCSRWPFLWPQESTAPLALGAAVVRDRGAGCSSWTPWA